MSDTQRTRAALITLMADNVTGQISAQDIRDFLVTIMEPEFVNPGDFWNKPKSDYITTDKTGKGWKLYSQTAGSDLSWMAPVKQSTDGEWVRAEATTSTMNGRVGLVMNEPTIASNATTLEILLEGIVYHSLYSVASIPINNPIYLASITSGPGSINWSLAADSVYMLGITVQDMSAPDSVTGKWYFSPGRWGIAGD